MSFPFDSQRGNTTMKNPIHAIAAATSLLLGSTAADAGIIFTEDFETAAGTTFITGPFGSTEREPGSYANGLTVAGWTLSAPLNTYLHDGVSGNTSLLLDSQSGSISRVITGLEVGVQHELTFEYWGDNTGIAGIPISFLFEINGVTTAVSRANTGLATGNFTTYAFAFTAGAASTQLRFVEQGGYGTLFDNISISSVDVPEPGTLALFSLGLLAAGGIRRTRRRS
jgi:hypothetical protein